MPLALPHPDEHSTIVGMNELIFEVTQEGDGGFVAECLTEPIFTQADTWEELRGQVQDAVRACYFDQPVPEQVRLHLVRDELLKTA
jgi:predicted RNase H-like HicB family nuclease